MEFYYLLMLTTSSHLVIATANSVPVEANTEAVDNNTCWTTVQIPCETSPTTQTGLIKDLSSKKSIGSTVIEDHDLDCYPWMFRNSTNGKCECSNIPLHSVLCDVEISRTSILDCYCMTYDSESNETQLGRCVYGCGHKTDTVFYPLPNDTDNLNSYSCGNMNRDSTLCGKCLPGYSPLLYSYEMKCMNCTGESMTYNWIKYIAVAYIPLTFFFFFVVIFKFNGNSPLLKLFISVSQGIVSPIVAKAFLSVVSRKAYIDNFTRALGSFYGIWNLDFFRTVIPPICATDISQIQVLALDYAIAFYPLLLVILTYFLISLHSHDVRIVVWLWRPFHKVFGLVSQSWDMEGSIVNAFATFFLLSYFKILNTTAYLLIFTTMYVLKDNNKEYAKKHVLYYDATVEYLGQEHLLYAIVALFVGVFIVILPIVFLIVYPMKWFQKCLNALKIQRQRLDMFVNCYQGYYKDGTNGTRDYRWFSVSYFILQLIMFVLFTVTQSIYCFSIGALFIVTLMFMHLSLRPYKEEFKVYDITDAFMLLSMSGMFIMAIAGDEAGIKASYFRTFSCLFPALIAIVPMIYFLVVTSWWLLVKKQFKTWCISKLRSFRTPPENPQIDESFSESDIPHRLENPSDYSSPNTPLISAVGKDAKYGSVA
ncbi:uncharacterized protein LOC135336288 [Halichondria panicea]|uniref:uncharacterized protein LOC135336288 n=1 Tax=Halichondria panicea TaxID=6063 RepID=UPI00312B4E2B